jgi:hypothetical protein
MDGIARYSKPKRVTFSVQKLVDAKLDLPLGNLGGSATLWIKQR